MYIDKTVCIILYRGIRIWKINIVRKKIRWLVQHVMNKTCRVISILSWLLAEKEKASLFMKEEIEEYA